jgi:hypothetical protein
MGEKGKKDKGKREKQKKAQLTLKFGDLKSSTEVVCQLLEETIQTVANGGLTLHIQ